MLRVDSGNEKLKIHLEKCKKNVTYTLLKIQNAIITLCGEVVKKNIFEHCQQVMVYTVIANERAAIAGKE